MTICSFSTFFQISVATLLTVCHVYMTSKSGLMILWHSPYISMLMLKKSIGNFMEAGLQLTETRFERGIAFHWEVKRESCDFEAEMGEMVVLSENHYVQNIGKLLGEIGNEMVGRVNTFIWDRMWDMSVLFTF